MEQECSLDLCSRALSGIQTLGPYEKSQRAKRESEVELIDETCMLEGGKIVTRHAHGDLIMSRCREPSLSGNILPLKCFS